MGSPHEHPSPRPATNPRPSDDTWVNKVADDVSALLQEQGLELEMVCFYDVVTETLHAVGFDGNPGRFFRSLGSDAANATSTHAETSAP